MAFWGIEVKPGKPFTHKFDDVRGRLHISMATLGFGNATSKSLLQCNVGNRSPVYLCSLYPEKSESLQLNLEFDEVDEVIFSVIGPRSIHLSGYYLDRGRNSGLNSDSESYGEDIADTDTQRSCDSDEDVYEDSFIDDGDQEMLSFSPVYSGGEEITHNKKMGNRRRLRKKYHLVESEPKTVASDSFGVPIYKREDEESFPISPLYESKTTAKDVMQEAEEDVDKANGETSYKKTDNKKPKIGKTSHRRLRKKLQLVESDDEGCCQSKTVADDRSGVPVSEREDEDTWLISSLYKSKTTAKKGTQEAQENVDKGTVETVYEKTEDRDMHDTESKRNVDIIVDGQAKRQFDMPVDLLMPYSEVGRENCGTPKKKRKERSAKGKPHEIDTDKIQQCDIVGHDLSVENGKEQELVNNNGAEMLNNFLLPATKVEPQSDERPKTKRKELEKEGKSFEIDSARNRNVVKENKAQLGETEADVMDEELPIRSGQNHMSANDQSFDHISCGFADGNLFEDTTLKKKKKKKRSKTQENIEAVNMDTPSSLFGEKNTCIGMESKNTMTPQVRTFPSGLVIEELKMGKPDGKVAASGKKLTVYYVGKLKNGEVIDSNVDSDPYKFRLGKGAVIEGWDAGLDGMRVGEKRRLTIPPSMGFQSEGDGKNIPPDSWLVYEVELVRVR